MLHNHSKNCKGFTLVELSVVIAIIGLLAGGILAGRSLIKGQNLRRVITDATSYMIAMNQFKQQYGYLAGDFPTATKVWGRVGGGTGNCAANATDISSGSTTCNGNGNGNLNAPDDAVVADRHETCRAWHHLFAAKLINGRFSGICNPAAGGYYTIGTNVPKGALEATGYAWMFGPKIVNDAVSVDAGYFDGDYSNALLFGKSTSGDGLTTGALTQPEQYELDLKADDGSPSTGSVRVWQSATNCITVDFTGTSGTYNVATNTEACAPIFLNTYKKAR